MQGYSTLKACPRGKYEKMSKYIFVCQFNLDRGHVPPRRQKNRNRLMPRRRIAYHPGHPQSPENSAIVAECPIWDIKDTARQISRENPF